MTKADKRAAYVAKCQAAELARREALGIKPQPRTVAGRPYRAAKRQEDTRTANRIDGFDRDDLGDSFD